MLKLKIPPVIVFLICLAMMWAINQQLPNNALLVGFRNILVYGLIALGGLIGILGVIEFARKSTTVNPHKPQNTKTFVQSGVYRFTRNPMYLGLLIVLLAAGFYWGNAFTLIVLPLFIGYMNAFQIQPEEEMMEQKFGADFISYKKEVRRWM